MPETITITIPMSDLEKAYACLAAGPLQRETVGEVVDRIRAAASTLTPKALLLEILYAGVAISSIDFSGRGAREGGLTG